jgi:hypothetical protein
MLKEKIYLGGFSFQSIERFECIGINDIYREDPRTFQHNLLSERQYIKNKELPFRALKLCL